MKTDAVSLWRDSPARPIDIRQRGGYPVTVRGVTLPLPVQQTLQPTPRGMRWKFRAIYESREAGDLFTDDDVMHNGATVWLMVTPEEERDIRIAALLRHRDTESRTIINATEHIRQIDTELRELGFEGSPEA